MNAREIVSLLLETEDRSVSERTGVYVFGPRLPEHGFNAKDLEQFFGAMEQVNILPKDAVKDRTTLDRLVKDGYTFFLKHDPGNIEVIGKIPANTTPEGQDKAMQYLGLQKGDKVKYRRLPSGNGQATTVERTMLGTKPKPAVQDEPVKTKELGVIDPKKENFTAPKIGVGYRGDIMPLNTPVNVGFHYAMNSTEGIQIMEVIPGGPAAQAGLQAGDVIIQTGKFAPADGSKPIGPFYVYNARHLEYVLRKASPDYPISFRVHRGDKDMWLPIMPEVKQKSMPQQTQQTQQAQAQPQQTQQTQAGKKPIQTSMAKTLFAGHNRGPRQRQLKLAPNEPSPARETGNPPANISSVT